MLNSFLVSLLESESLIDVGFKAIASQSSYSKWSKDNDAQRALTGEFFSDFAFHTEKEQNPWWQIEWQSPILLRYIIINNRKIKPFDKIAAPLKVFVTDKNDQEFCVYEGKLVFGSLPNSIPLILPLDGQYEVKKVKIELQDYNYLHLSNIHFLRKKSLQEQKGKLLFFANRTDGLGERLRALLNAMYHADKYQGEFYFSWKDISHREIDMDNREGIFSKKTIEQHCFDSEYVETKLKLIPLHMVRELSFNSVSEYDGIQVEQSYTNYYPNFLQQLEFSSILEKIKQDVMSVDLSACTVAVHIRTGDIVYGEIWRHTNIFYKKVQPLYVMEKMIEILQAKGFEVLLFSLEAEVCRYLARNYGVKYANDLIPDNLSSTQTAFFEMFLMSRCKKIFAKESGFAIFPALMSGAERLSYEQYLTKGEIQEAFWHSIKPNGFLNIPEMNNVLKAFMVSHFVDYFFDELNQDQISNLVNMMCDLDPKNVYYCFMKAVVLYSEGFLQEADEILYHHLTDGTSVIYKRFAEKWSNRTIISRHVDVFKAAAESGSAIGAIVTLLNDFSVNDNIDYMYYDGIVNTIHSRNPKSVGLDLLEQKLKEFSTHRLN